METPHFDKSIKKLDFLFRFSGMNLHKRIKTPKDTIKYRFKYAINTVIVVSTEIFIIYAVIIGVIEGKELTELTTIFACMAYAAVAVLKSIYHLIHEEKVQKLIEIIRKLELDRMKREKCVHEEEMVKKETTYLHRIIYVLCAINFLLVVGFNFTPLISMILKYYKTNELVFMLPYYDYFVILPYDFKFWVFGYLHEVWTECIVHLELLAADYLLFTCCTYIRVQFKLLQNDFEKLLSRNVSDIRDYKEILSNLVKRHQDLISCSEMLETIYSQSMLLNFLVSSFVICLTGFTSTVVKDVIVVFTYITFLSMSLLQVFFLCFYADLLMSSSTEVSDAVYNSQWYMGTAGLEKQLLIVQIRAQKACKLTTAGFTDVNLRSFMKVISTAWSYFAVLQTMYK